MDWIVWEMLEKLKSDRDIFIRMRDEAKAIYLDTTTIDKLYWKGIVAGYNTQIRWTQDNIDKLENMIEEEVKSESDYSEHRRQLRSIGRGYIREYDDPEPTGGLWSTETGDVY